VEDMVEISGRRLLKLRNPWSRGGIPHSSLTHDKLAALSSTASPSLPSLYSSDNSYGTFWIDLEEFLQSFKTLYLNWNPCFFRHSAKRHFTFASSGSAVDLSPNPQFLIKSDMGGEVWIFLERHILQKKEEAVYIGLSVYEGTDTIYSYSKPLERVILPTL
jgi:hypothetical protein